MIRYTAKFKASDLKDANKLALDLVDVGNTAEVYLNGEYLGSRLCKPFVFDLSGKIKEENRLIIEVSNTLANKVKDHFTNYYYIKKAGLNESVLFRY